VDTERASEATLTSSGERRPVVLVIDSDRDATSALRGFLRIAGFDVISFERDSRAVKALEDGEIEQPGAIIVDPSAPGMSGLVVCQTLRDISPAPIIVISTAYSETSVVAALQNGADEYLAKPVPHGEVAARLQAMLRRSSVENGRKPSDHIVAGDLHIFLADHSVQKGGRKIDLSPTEFRLLSCLAGAPGKLLSHRTLMARVWGAEYVESRHYLRLYIRYLREKLEDDPSHPRLILSEWGMGYRFQPPAPSG
jgi:two-component system KDP operon response regulator KdpE